MTKRLILYKFLCLLRIAIVFMPQTGYIHPDEHFQGPEVAYGDIAGYNVLYPWEFSLPKPIRSVIFPYSFAAIPAMLTKLFAWLHFRMSSYWLLILPRLLMCTCSFLQDVSIYRICVNFKIDYKPCLTLFASSYVTIVYFTRTFSNSMESILFGTFLFLLARGLKLGQNETNSDEDQILKQLTYCSFMSGIVLGLGIFIRPTFVCFSIFPLIVWCLKFYKVNIISKVNILISFFLGSFSMVTCLTAIDSLYYNKINNSLDKNFSIICTPMNFIFYNLNTENLSSHGLHFRGLHALVNIPLLFSVYGIILLIYFVLNIHSIFSRFNLNFETIFLFSFFTPLISLSLVPHQEPRFIIPLIIPLSLLYSSSYLRRYLSSKFCLYLWISNNISCLIFYGFFHQAGVYLSASYLNNVIENNNAVIFYKTYMPPRYLLSINEKHKNSAVYDFAGSSLDEFEARMQDIISHKRYSKVYIVLPYKILNTDITFESLTMSNYKFMEKRYFSPHLSTETLPTLLNIFYILEKNTSVLGILNDIQELFSIHIILFERYFT